MAGELPSDFENLRLYSLGAAVAGMSMAAVSLYVWFKDTAKQQPCPTSSATVFNYVLIGKWGSGILLFLAALAGLASLPRTSHRLAATVASVLILIALASVVFAVQVHHGHVSSCFTF